LTTRSTCRREIGVCDRVPEKSTRSFCRYPNFFTTHCGIGGRKSPCPKPARVAQSLRYSTGQTEYGRTEGQTDRRTRGDSKYRASIASRGKTQQDTLCGFHPSLLRESENAIYFLLRNAFVTRLIFCYGTPTDASTINHLFNSTVGSLRRLCSLCVPKSLYFIDAFYCYEQNIQNGTAILGHPRSL